MYKMDLFKASSIVYLKIILLLKKNIKMLVIGLHFHSVNNQCSHTVPFLE